MSTFIQKRKITIEINETKTIERNETQTIEINETKTLERNTMVFVRESIDLD